MKVIQFIKQNLHDTAGPSTSSFVTQTANLVKDLGEEKGNDFEEADIQSSSITAEGLVALKADLGSPWKKLRTMSRFIIFNKLIHLKYFKYIKN